MFTRKKRPFGFTLIELIAVIIIIVCLAAIILARYRSVSAAAKNAVILQFIKDCSIMYGKMYYGNSTTGYATASSPMPVSTYIQGGSAGGATATISGSELIITGLPTSLFSDHSTSLTISYSSGMYLDGGTWYNQADFLSHVIWH